MAYTNRKLPNNHNDMTFFKSTAEVNSTQLTNYSVYFTVPPCTHLHKTFSN